jgi:predicted DNA-binding transcriptional regulator AlpA
MRKPASASAPSPTALGLLEFASLEQWLDITRPTLIKMSREPDFPKAIRIGHRKYVHEVALRRWIDERFGVGESV